MDNDGILNVKSEVKCEHSTGDLNGIQREYLISNEVNSEYQCWPTNVIYSTDNQDHHTNCGNNYGLNSRSNNVENHSSLPREILPHTSITLHSNIMNNGEREKNYLLWYIE